MCFEIGNKVIWADDDMIYSFYQSKFLKSMGDLKGTVVKKMTKGNDRYIDIRWENDRVGTYNESFIINEKKYKLIKNTIVI
jgi:hypothetical protein